MIIFLNDIWKQIILFRNPIETKNIKKAFPRWMYLWKLFCFAFSKELLYVRLVLQSVQLDSVELPQNFTCRRIDWVNRELSPIAANWPVTAFSRLVRIWVMKKKIRLENHWERSARLENRGKTEKAITRLSIGKQKKKKLAHSLRQKPSIFVILPG